MDEAWRRRTNGCNGLTSEGMIEGSFACLTYHQIGAAGDQYRIAEPQLRTHLRALKLAGYAVEGFEQLQKRLAGSGGIPHRYVVITFDDGHESSMRAADLLAEFGCFATFFLTRDRCLGKPEFVRGPDIRDLRKRGFSLGTHGTTHQRLSLMPDDKCIAELRESKAWLEDIIGESVAYMAAPGGFVDSRVLRFSFDCGYVLAATCRERMNRGRRMVLPSAVDRVAIRRHFSDRILQDIVKGRQIFYMKRWVRNIALAIPKRFF